MKLHTKNAINFSKKDKTNLRHPYQFDRVNVNEPSVGVRLFECNPKLQPSAMGSVHCGHDAKVHPDSKAAEQPAYDLAG